MHSQEKAGWHLSHMAWLPGASCQIVLNSSINIMLCRGSQQRSIGPNVIIVSRHTCTTCMSFMPACTTGSFLHAERTGFSGFLVMLASTAMCTAVNLSLPRPTRLIARPTQGVKCLKCHILHSHILFTNSSTASSFPFGSSDAKLLPWRGSCRQKVRRRTCTQEMYLAAAALPQPFW